MDKDNSGLIEFDEFIHILDHPMITLSKEDIKKSIEECFKRLESEQGEFMISVPKLRNILTRRGKMKMSDEEVDDLIKKVSPDSLKTDTVDYRLIVDLFVKDYDKVNIVGDNFEENNNVNGNHLDIPEEEQS